MQKDKKNADSVIAEVAGEDTIKLVNYLKGKKNISEFKIAKDIGQEINGVRNMLYRLYDANLVSFIRKKDKQKGWYIYYWTFNPRHVSYLATHLKKKKLERLKERLGREKESDFYICKNNCIRLDFDQATDFEYKCPECGSIMEKEDNAKKISEISKEIEKIEKDLKSKVPKLVEIEEPKNLPQTATVKKQKIESKKKLPKKKKK